VLRPPAPPVAALQLSLALLPLAAPAHYLRLASAACTPARPVANLPARIGLVSFGSTGCKPPTRVDCSALPIDLWRSIKLALDDPVPSGLRPTVSFHPACAVWPFLRPGRQPTSDSHRMPIFGSACGFIRLAPYAAPASPSGFRLRIAPVAFALRLHRPSTAWLAPCDRFSG